MNKKKLTAEKQGRLAERLARFFYFLMGYQLVHARYLNPLGEVDLIFKRAHLVVFVEVKYRKNQNEALSALTPHQMNRIRRGARWFLMKNPKLSLCDLRFDFIVFSKWRFKRLKNAF